MRLANRIRTTTQAVTVIEAAIDLTKIAHAEDITAITLIPQTISTILLQGQPGDDFINIKGGAELVVDFKKGGVLPKVKGTGSVNLDIIFSVKLRNP